MKKELKELEEQKAMMDGSKEQESELRKRFEMFHKVIHQNLTLQEFDREVFESIVEKVITGGYDEDGNKDPYQITFIYKTGYQNDIADSKQKYDILKKPGRKKGSKNVNISRAQRAKEYKGNADPDDGRQDVNVCLKVNDNACGDSSIDDKSKIKNIIENVITRTFCWCLVM